MVMGICACCKSIATQTCPCCGAVVCIKCREGSGCKLCHGKKKI